MRNDRWEYAARVAALVVALAAGCRREPQSEVVVYTALDRMFSEPILQAFEKQTGIRALAKYDTEATKTVGLVQAIRAENGRPRCDVFWNNEIVNTIRLQREGLLTPYRPAAAAGIPDAFKDPDGYWTGFAARARVLLVNTNLVPAGEEPNSIRSLADPKWKGRAGIAKPLFGTTATHAACLFAAWGDAAARDFFRSLRENRVQIQSGNRTAARNVANGALAFCLTDTDDAIAEIESGSPVRIVYPDAQPGQIGVLFIPNTLSLIQNAPHPEAAKKLIEYLLSPDVETALAASKSAQIPLNPAVQTKPRVRTPAEAPPMKVDFARAAEAFASTAAYIEQHFLK
jgi:iron(III) transport system substrate-binding protein